MRDTDLVLGRFDWLAVLVALAIVGVSTFTQPFGPFRNFLEIVAFTIAAIALVLRTASDRSDAWRPRLAGLMPFAWGAMAVLCGLAALTNSGGPFSLLASMAAVAAGSTLSLPVAGAITAAGAATIASAGLAYGADGWKVLFYPLVLVLGLVFGRLLHDYRLQVEVSAALLGEAEQLRKEQGRSATLDERNRIAREIHDLLAHSLGALGVQIQAAQAVLIDRGDIDRAVDLLGQARRTAAEGLNDTRLALHALRADTPPLPEAMAEMSADHERRYSTQVRFEVSGSPRSLSADAGLALTRTAQEALINTAKHAPRQPVEVRLDYEESQTALTVVSQLAAYTGSDPLLETANGGYGLAGMRERLLLIDGSLSAGPAQGNWIVTAQVPQ